MTNINLKSIFLLILLALGFLTGCNNSNNNKIYTEYTYRDEEISFRFEYPEYWTVEKQPSWEASEKKEASPEKGVIIFNKSNKTNSIEIFNSVSPYSIPTDDSTIQNNTKSKESNIKEIFTNKIDNKVNIHVLYKDKENIIGYYNAVVTADEDFYNEYEDVIWHILMSVDYN